jgi:hypothetical protein
VPKSGAEKVREHRQRRGEKLLCRTWLSYDAVNALMSSFCLTDDQCDDEADRGGAELTRGEVCAAIIEAWAAGEPLPQLKKP